MPESLKILFYISTIRGGGAARVMVNVANGLQEKGYGVCLVTNFPAEHEYALNPGIRRVSLEKSENSGGTLAKNLSRISALRRVIRAERPDVCVAFMRENNFRLIPAARGLRTRTVVSVRNDPARAYRRKGDRFLANRLFARADRIVFQTEDAREWFPEDIRRKSAVIFNQVDERFFADSRQEGNYIIACGRLSPQKNYPVMLKAFAEVLKSHPDEELRIYGEGALKEELEELCGELGISGSVRFMGFSGEMPEAYRSARMLFLSSDYEGMPNVLLEAFASSVPAVSTDCPCGGPRMVIEDGKNGFLVPAGDVQAFAAAAKRLLESPGMRAEMGKNARATAEKFTPEKVLREWEELIRSVCAGR